MTLAYNFIHDSTQRVRAFRCDDDGPLLREREPQSLVRAGICGFLRFRLNVWFPARSVAVWIGRSPVGGHCLAQMVVVSSEDQICSITIALTAAFPYACGTDVGSADRRMHRTISRLLLIVWLAGIAAPVVLAISAPAPHACCLRSAHSHGAPNSFQAVPSCCQHNCCSPLTVSHWAKVAEVGSSHFSISISPVRDAVESRDLPHRPDRSRPVRAPPLSA